MTRKKKAQVRSENRVPPQNLDAERWVMGGLFIKGRTVDEIFDILRPGDFYSDVHKILFETVYGLWEQREPIDLVTVKNALEVNGHINTVGGEAYLLELVDSVMSPANILHHAQIVADKALQRSYIEAASNIMQQSFEGGSPDELAELSQKLLLGLSLTTSTAPFENPKALAEESINKLAERINNPESIRGVPTGLGELDYMLNGLKPGQLIVVAGRPGTGKTSFALNICLKAALHWDHHVGIFSMEMEKDEIMDSLICIESQLDTKDFEKGRLSQSDFTKAAQVADLIAEKANIHINDTPSMSPTAIAAKCRKLVIENNLDLLVVDYMQLMEVLGKENRTQEISEVSRQMKQLAKELKLPIIALSQLNRKVEERTDKRPIMADLRESGQIEQDADVILFLYRDAVYNTAENNPLRNICEVNIAKQRRGSIGKVELHFKDWCTRFENAAPKGMER